MERPETVPDVAFYHPLIAAGWVDEAPRFLDRVLRPASGPESNEVEQKSASKIGSSTSLAAIWTIRSRRAGMPSF